MKKHKIKGLAKYADMHEEVTLTGADGAEVVVRTHIPYAEKVKMAQGMAELIIMLHDDSCWYLNHEEQAIRAKAIVENYTDINTDGVEPGHIMDFLVNNALYDKLMETIRDDFVVVEDLYSGMVSSLGITYDDDRSLRKAIKTSFGFLFNGEDITESMAKAEATKETIYKAVGALREKEEAEANKLNGNGSMSIGGNIIQFGKRE